MRYEKIKKGVKVQQNRLRSSKEYRELCTMNKYYNIIIGNVQTYREFL